MNFSHPTIKTSDEISTRGLLHVQQSSGDLGTHRAIFRKANAQAKECSCVAMFPELTSENRRRCGSAIAEFLFIAEAGPDAQRPVPEEFVYNGDRDRVSIAYSQPKRNSLADAASHCLQLESRIGDHVILHARARTIGQKLVSAIQKKVASVLAYCHSRMVPRGPSNVHWTGKKIRRRGSTIELHNCPVSSTLIHSCGIMRASAMTGRALDCQ